MLTTRLALTSKAGGGFNIPPVLDRPVGVSAFLFGEPAMTKETVQFSEAELRWGLRIALDLMPEDRLSRWLAAVDLHLQMATTSVAGRRFSPGSN